MGIWSYGVASAYYKSVPFALFLNHLFYFLFGFIFFFINYSTFVNFLKSHSLYKASLDQPKYLPYEKCLLELEFSPVLDFKVNLISSFSHVCAFFPHVKILCSLKSEKCLSRAYQRCLYIILPMGREIHCILEIQINFDHCCLYLLWKCAMMASASVAQLVSLIVPTIHQFHSHMYMGLFLCLRQLYKHIWFCLSDYLEKVKYISLCIEIHSPKLKHQLNILFWLPKES